MLLGVIADDFTGATDIAGFLVKGGLPTVQLNGVPEGDVDTGIAEAVVISLKSRSTPAQEAVEESLAAYRWLKDHGCSQFFIKYASTFDSTPKGNIGPVTDALMRELGVKSTVICASLPVNGRTTYNGYLFVNGVLLSESGMRHHPLNPMLDSSLMRLMEAQAQGKSANINVDSIEKGSREVADRIAALTDEGCSYIVLDTLNDRHLAIIAEAVASMRLITGSSGLGGALAAYASAGKQGCDPAIAVPPGGKSVILSGSCSLMTNAQVNAYKDTAVSIKVRVEDCLHDAKAYADTITGELLGRLASEGRAAAPGDILANAPDGVVGTPSGRAPLVYATVPKEELNAIQSRYGAETVSHAVEAFFAQLAKNLRKQGFDRFIVAGGETSGTVTQALGISGFHIGCEIAPGVPWVASMGDTVYLALKSGNFGDERFFFTAQDSIAS